MGDLPYTRASEVQAYCYCARRWWLQYVCGVEPRGTEALETGREAHREHARKVVAAGRLRRLAWALLVIGLGLVVAGAMLVGKG